MPEIDTGHLIKSWIASLVRLLLVGVMGFFIRKGIVTAQLGTDTIAAIVAGTVAVVWALWHKWHMEDRIRTALGLPAGSSPEQLAQKMKEK